jgi:signal transduction histidine kinase
MSSACWWSLVVRRRTPGAFPQNTVDLIKTFAAQSVLAIQNARLFENVETHTRELAKSLQDLRIAQDRLVQTEKLASLGQLTAGIAHEIKNPLNFVNNFSAVRSNSSTNCGRRLAACAAYLEARGRPAMCVNINTTRTARCASQRHRNRHQIVKIRLLLSASRIWGGSSFAYQRSLIGKHYGVKHRHCDLPLLAFSHEERCHFFSSNKIPSLRISGCKDSASFASSQGSNTSNRTWSSATSIEPLAT